jgi:hypothetical protein
VIDVSALQVLLVAVTAWLDRREREALAYLIEENRLRRRLAVRAYRVGRQALREVATIVTRDTLLRWHRQLIARKWMIPLGERHFRRPRASTTAPGRAAQLLRACGVISRLGRALDNTR